MAWWGKKPNKNEFQVHGVTIAIGRHYDDVVLFLSLGNETVIIQALLGVLSHPGPHRIIGEDNIIFGDFDNKRMMILKTKTPELLYPHVADTLTKMASMPFEEIEALAAAFLKTHNMAKTQKSDMAEAKAHTKAREMANHLVKKVIKPWARRNGLLEDMDPAERKTTLRRLRDALIADKLAPPQEHGR